MALAAPSDAAAQTAPVIAGYFGVPVSDWTGAYVGGHMGAAWGQSDWSASGPAFPQSGVLGLGDPFDFAAGTGSYFEGLQAGYNRELPSGLVIGAQADVSFPNTLLGTQTIAAAGFDVADYEEKVLFSGTLRGRLGYASRQSASPFYGSCRSPFRYRYVRPRHGAWVLRRISSSASG